MKRIFYLLAVSATIIFSACGEKEADDVQPKTVAPVKQLNQDSLTYTKIFKSWKLAGFSDSVYFEKSSYDKGRIKSGANTIFRGDNGYTLHTDVPTNKIDYKHLLCKTVTNDNYTLEIVSVTDNRFDFKIITPSGTQANYFVR